jgi:hypothetical protein
VGLDVWRYSGELFVQLHECDVIEHSGMSCLPAESRERGLPGRLLDGNCEGEPAVDGFRKRTCSSTCNRPCLSVHNESQDAPPDHQVIDSAGGATGSRDSPILDPPGDPPDAPPDRAGSQCFLTSGHGFHQAICQLIAAFFRTLRTWTRSTSRGMSRTRLRPVFL